MIKKERSKLLFFSLTCGRRKHVDTLTKLEGSQATRNQNSKPYNGRSKQLLLKSSRNGEHRAKFQPLLRLQDCILANVTETEKAEGLLACLSTINSKTKNIINVSLGQSLFYMLGFCI